MSAILEILFIFIPYLKPHNITLIPNLDLFFKIWKITATAWLLIKIIKKGKISRSYISIAPFCITWILSMLVNKSISQDVLNGIMSILGINLYYEYYKDDLKVYDTLIYCLGLIAKIYLTFQIVTLLILDGPLFVQLSEYTSDRFFLGGDNLSAFIMIVLTTIMFYSDDKRYSKLKMESIVIFILEIISLIKQFVGAGMASFILFGLIMCLRNNKKILKWVTPQKALIALIIFVAFVTYGNLADIMSGLLTKVGKTGFNGRTDIWLGVIHAIACKPILGYGSITNVHMMQELLNHTNHTHNILLEFIFEVGFLGTALFVYYIKCNTQIKSKSNPILMIGLSIYILNAIFDFYITSIYFYLLILIIFWDYKINHLIEAGSLVKTFSRFNNHISY